MSNNTYLVATASGYRDKVVDTVYTLDRKASVIYDINPCTLRIKTKLTVLSLDAITGVAHVFEISAEGKVVDTYGHLEDLRRSRQKANRIGNQAETRELDIRIAEEISRLRSTGKLGTLDLEHAGREDA